MKEVNDRKEWLSTLCLNDLDIGGERKCAREDVELLISVCIMI